MIAAIGCGLGAALLARRRTAARYAFATTAAPLLMLYTPGIAPLAGQVVTPYLLWRFTWLLPLALALAVATTGVGRLAARRIPGKRWAGPVAATAFALATALATGLPSDLARVPASLELLTPTAIPAAAAERWIAPLRTHVDDETMLLGPTTQPLVLSLGSGIRTGWWRSGSDPERYARVVDFFGSRLFAPRHAALLDELDVGFVGVLHDEPIATELALRTERFAPVARLGELELHRVIDHSPAPDPIDYWRARSRAAADRAERTVARGRLSLALLQADRLDEARSELETAIARGDADAATHEQRGTLALLDGDPRRARDELQRSLALDPERAMARNNLVWLLATSPVEAIRDPDEAVRQAEILLSGRTPDAGSFDTAAAAWAADGDFERAEQLARRSLLLYESAGARADALLPIRERLDAYRAHRPWIDVAD
jgi:hypothetical protein